MLSNHSRPLSAYFFTIGRYAPQIEPYATLPPVTYAVSGAIVRPKPAGIWASTPSMIRMRLACEVDSVLTLPLPTRPVSMSMSMPSKLYVLRIGTWVALLKTYNFDGIDIDIETGL